MPLGLWRAVGLSTTSKLSLERHEQRPEHVERRHEDGDERQPEDDLTHRRAVAPRVSQDLVFAPEPRQRKDTGQAQGADEERDVSEGHHLSEAAHIAHVEGVRRVAHVTRTQK